MEKDKWITEILSSTDGIKKVKPSELLFEKIQNRISKNVDSTIVWLVAASFLILFALNVKIIADSKNTSGSELTLLAKSIAPNNQLY